MDRPNFLSPAGAPWLVAYDLPTGRGEAWRRALIGRRSSLWRYRELLPVADFAAAIDLGEGLTPLIPLRRLSPGGAKIWVKQEAGNPTGSFKDRGLSLAVNRARELGAPGVELASAGNAAIAMTAYAAAAGLPSRVALPEDTPGTVAERCRASGAEVVVSPGTLVEARARLAEGSRGYWDLSTLREPYRVEGKKTMGFELLEQFGWDPPDWVVYPTGGGTGIVGMYKAFQELRQLGLLPGRFPRLVVVQTEGCAPIVRAFEDGKSRAARWENPDTRVWGLRVPAALGDFLVLDAVRATGGTALAVDEARIPAAATELAGEGILAGPEGALTWAAVQDLVAAGSIRSGEKVVVFQTGHPGNYV